MHTLRRHRHAGGGGPTPDPTPGAGTPPSRRHETEPFATAPTRAGGARRLDPRLYQIACLAGLLAYGLWRLDFQVGPAQIAVTIATALATQLACTRLWRLPRFDPRSALISSLSLCLLLRANRLEIVALAAAITIASKFTLRWNDKHLFNPTNFGLVATMLLTGGAWVSPGQWGNAAYFGFLMACLGGLVVNRAARSDVTYAFMAAYASILFGRALWLGQPVAIPLHHLQNGALLLFTFFMISDPRTTPDARAGRILFAILVAAGAALVPFSLHRTNGLLWSLATFALFVPLIDRVLPGPRFAWTPAPARVRGATAPGPDGGRPPHRPSNPPLPIPKGATP